MPWGRTARLRWRGVILISLLAAATGCASGGVDTEPSPVPDRIDNFLLPTLDGYSGALNPGWREQLDAAYTALAERGEVAVARAAADALLELDQGSLPARVLAGQVGLVEGRHAEVVELLQPALADFPDYHAGQMALGRAAELDDQVAVAYGAYRLVAGHSDVARRRAGTLEKRAVQAVQEELDEALWLNRMDEAARTLQLLEEWQPEERTTWEARREVLAAEEKPLEELEVLREMASRWEPDRLELERQGNLELEVGDPRSGLKIYQDLSERYPHDPEIARGLAVAKFRWRLLVLPPDVQSVVERAELTRGDFATMLYWLIPNVRSGAADSARIAADALDHSQRDAIVRVVNLGLMNVDDATLHRFAPDRPVTRIEALQSLLQVLEKSGDGAACVDALRLTPTPSWSFVCRTAVRCGLLIEEAECLPGAALEGPAARELIRRTLVALGQEPR